MRKLLLFIGACAVLGGGARIPGGDVQRVRDLLMGIGNDVAGILTSLEGGPDNPKGPVQNQATLKDDSARLDAAQLKAEQLAAELGKLQDQAGEPGR